MAPITARNGSPPTHAATATPPTGPTVRTILVANRAGAPPENFPADLDWKAYALVQRLHLLDHRNQVRAVRAALARPASTICA